MPRAVTALVALFVLFAFQSDSARGEAPSYSSATLVNSASNEAGFIAPNTFVTIYGTNLAHNTRALAGTDINANTLPTVLPGTGVSVWINHVAAQMYYVSPNQINALIPSDTLPGPATIQVAVDGTYGPKVSVTIQNSAAALFQLDSQTPIAVRGDGSVVTSDAPARPGEWITLFATGLGLTKPPAPYGVIPLAAAALQDLSQFGMLVDGSRVDGSNIAYAGVAPGFAGLYQINFRVPETVAGPVEIRVQTAGTLSKAGLLLPVKP